MAQYLLPAMVWLLHYFPEAPTRKLYHKVLATVSFSAQPFHVVFSQRRISVYSRYRYFPPHHLHFKELSSFSVCNAGSFNPIAHLFSRIFPVSLQSRLATISLSNKTCAIKNPSTKHTENKEL